MWRGWHVMTGKAGREQGRKIRGAVWVTADMQWKRLPLWGGVGVGKWRRVGVGRGCVWRRLVRRKPDAFS